MHLVQRTLSRLHERHGVSRVTRSLAETTDLTAQLLADRETCGVVTVEKKGNVVTDRIDCGSLLVKGKVKGGVATRPLQRTSRAPRGATDPEAARPNGRPLRTAKAPSTGHPAVEETAALAA